MIHLVLWLLMIGGLIGLCAANPRHQSPMLGRRLPAAASARLGLAAKLAIGVGAVIAFWQLGFAYGLVEIAGLASLAAILTVSLLSFRTGKSRKPR